MKLTDELQVYDQCLRQFFPMHPNYKVLTYLLTYYPVAQFPTTRTSVLQKIVNTGLSASGDGV
jgi:hypothetical protein